MNRAFDDDSLVETALQRAREAALDGAVAPRRAPEALRWFLVGDPQAPAETFFQVLDRQGLLGDDGWLRPGVGLVSLGDHFDYSGAPVNDASGDDLRILAWLAAHDPQMVRILLGNHDAVRVMEFAGIGEAHFQRARQLAEGKKGNEPLEGFPSIPTAGTARKDFASYTPRQADLVRRLLLEGCYRLACAVRLDSVTALATHAGVTTRELSLLGLAAERDPGRLADALNRFLAGAVDAVRSDWNRGHLRPLDLAPLHLTGTSGQEGGGLLYHRPGDPTPVPGSGLDVAWAFGDPERPRRFAPWALPDHLVQISAHTTHRKCKGDIGRWMSPEALATPWASLRTLTVRGVEVQYVLGVHVAPPPAATLILADPHMSEAPGYQLQLLEGSDVA